MALVEGLRDGYRHPFFVVIERLSLSPAHSSLLWSNCVIQHAAASLCDDWTRNDAIGVVHSNARSQHTRRRRRLGFAQAERLREGYRVLGAVGGSTARDQKSKNWRESRLGV